MNYFEFNGKQTSAVFKGNWQMAGGHGKVEYEQAIQHLFAYTEHGINVFDMGDAYTGVEELLGNFRKEHTNRFSQAETDKLSMHTKFIPDLNTLEDLSKKEIRSVIERSCARLGMRALDLVQFHWWDFSKGNYIEAAQHLQDLKQEGLIKAIGLTNFDCERTTELLDAGIDIVSNQVQFSLVDTRAHNGMLNLAKKRDIKLFCYGSLAGGLLAGAPYDPENRSHVKYGLVAEEAGDYSYKNIMSHVASLATKYKTTRANIAAKFVLQTEGVSSVILGPRDNRHLAELDDLSNLTLTADDYASLDTLARSNNANGQDIYSYERVTDGRHAAIMHYNSNNMRPSV